MNLLLISEAGFRVGDAKVKVNRWCCETEPCVGED
jgi:hypothetical protein